MLESLGIALCAFDAEDRVVMWNGWFVRMFPEHVGHVHVGEAYAENLRRFYRGRLDDTERPYIERYIAAGIERHRRQASPFEFYHRGQWLRVASLPQEDGGRVRIWVAIDAPLDGRTVASAMAHGGRNPPLGSLDGIADGLLVRNPEGRITVANARFAEIYRVDREEIIGLHVSEVLARVWEGEPGAEDALLALTDNSRFTGAPFEVALPGDRRVRVSEQRALDGSMICTHVDVTETHRLQRVTAEAQRYAERLAESLRDKVAALEASSREIELLLSVMPGGLLRVRLTPEGTMMPLYVSPEAEKLTGYQPSEIGGGLLLSRLREGETARLRAKVAEAARTGSATIELDFHHRDGTWRRMHGSLRGDPQAPGGRDVIMLWSDVTEAHQRLVENAQASRLITLGEMASGIAHELNQPLAAIALLTATAAAGLEGMAAAPADLLRNLDRIGDQAIRAGRIIHSLHDMTRPERAVPEEVSLDEMVTQTLSLVGAMIRADGIAIEVLLPDGLPRVRGQRTRLQQTLINVLSNARFALLRTKPGRPAIRIAAGRIDAGVDLVVTDNGGGIPEDVIGRVFDPFFTTKGPDQGTGLGLSIARAAIRSMQGDISVCNTDDGAQFTLHLVACVPEPMG